jgi:hypothetical protein
MKKFTSIAIAFLLALSVVPAMAADQTDSPKEFTTFQAVDKVPATFQAFSNLAVTERETLTPLTDKELEAIEGSDVCAFCINNANIYQANVAYQNASSYGSGNASNRAYQSNYASVYQSIN